MVTAAANLSDAAPPAATPQPQPAPTAVLPGTGGHWLDRDNDSGSFSGGGPYGIAASWWAVALTWQPYAPDCTTGFGVHTKGDPNHTYLLTAGHCRMDRFRLVAADDNFYTPRLTKIGPMTSDLPGQDVALIDAPSGNAIFDGGAKDTAFKKRVAGTANPRLGETVCISGAVSGAHCGLEVVATDTSHTLGETTYTGLTELRAPKGTIVATHGDSGGPVFVLGPQPDTVLAVGTITGGTTHDGEAALDDDGYQHLWIASVQTALTAFNIELNT